MIVILEPPAVEILNPSFALWERAFHAHPCEAMLCGSFICGADSPFRLRVECDECGEAREPAFLCEVHMTAGREYRMVYHLECGSVVVMRNVERIT